MERATDRSEQGTTVGAGNQENPAGRTPTRAFDAADPPAPGQGRRPLDGIRVLDLTRVLAGPYSTMMLADFGADVVKIEQPGEGDDSRAFGPFVHGESAYFMSLNRNKRSVAMNLKDPKDRAWFLSLVEKADVVVENYRPGTMEKLGLGYETLKKTNQRLIYAACSGFGQTGPYRNKPAYDIIVQAMSGMMSITGEKDGLPTRVGASIGDIIAGMNTAYGILLALYDRTQTGEGQMVDVGMLDAQFAVLENAVARYLVTGESPKPMGNRHPSITPFASFAASDGHLVLGAGNDRLWTRLCEVLARKDLLEDPRFATNADRTTHADALFAELNLALSPKPVADWLETLEAAGIPCAPIHDMAGAVADPHLRARNMLVEVTHPTAGSMLVPGIPVKLSATPGRVVSPAPRLNEHAEDVRHWLD